MKDFYGKNKPVLMIKAALDLMHEPGSVFEVRIPNATRYGTIAGYFNDTAKAATAITKYNGDVTAIYVTANPVNPALLARNENKLELTKTLTTDAEIVKRNWFLIDFDPKRPSGISSTDAELESAKIKAGEVVDWLTSLGWPEPVQACSGNGWHVMYRVDEPNDKDALADFEFALKMLSSIFSDDKVDVDTTNFNAARVWKVYGTVSAKGNDTADRPWRLAALTAIPKEFHYVERQLIETLARALRDSRSDEYKDSTGEYIQDMVKWLSDRGVTVASGPRPLFGHDGQKWVLNHCPFDHNHKGPIVGLVNNRPVFRCLHHSCAQYRWKEFREKIDPNYRDPDDVQRRLIEWCQGSQEEVDHELVQSACATGNKLDKIFGKLKKEVPRGRFLILEEAVKVERRRYMKEVIGENNEKGNIVGLINRIRSYQSEGIVPCYWTADYDQRVRVGDIGDIYAEKLEEKHEIGLMVKFHSAGDIWVKQTHCAQAIRHIAAEYCVNPLRIFLKRKTWDGVKRLDSWLPHYMRTKDDKYTRAVGRKWLISAVARAMDPGCQVDHMLIFEGKQGIGKSKALRILGGDFYLEYSGGIKSDAAQKDMVHSIIGKMIVEMSELATIRKSEIETLKALLTKTHDDQRLSYERDSKCYPRTCVFSGTTNETDRPYIADASGARRFWPVAAGATGPLRLEELQSDTDQLWAEAVEAYEAGEDWYSVPKELVLAEQEMRQVQLEDSDPWYIKVRNALTDPDSYTEALHAIPEYALGKPTGNLIIRAGAIASILGIVLQVDSARQNSADTARVQNILREIGFKRVRPNKGWMGSSTAYDLTKDALPHLWSSIEAAAKSVKFPKKESQDQD